MLRRKGDIEELVERIESRLEVLREETRAIRDEITDFMSGAERRFVTRITEGQKLVADAITDAIDLIRIMRTESEKLTTSTTELTEIVKQIQSSLEALQTHLSKAGEVDSRLSEVSEELSKNIAELTPVLNNLNMRLEESLNLSKSHRKIKGKREKSS